MLIVAWIYSSTAALRKDWISTIWSLRLIVLLQYQIVVFLCSWSLLPTRAWDRLWLEIPLSWRALLVFFSCWLLREHHLWRSHPSFWFRTWGAMKSNHEVERVWEVLDQGSNEFPVVFILILVLTPDLKTRILFFSSWRYCIKRQILLVIEVYVLPTITICWIEFRVCPILWAISLIPPICLLVLVLVGYIGKLAFDDI